MEKPLRVMVVDDTITYRMIMKSVTESIPGTQVVASAPNGKVALEKVAQQPPEVVLLDVEMPVMDGLATLKRLTRDHPEVTVVMVSGLSRSNANIVMECLGAGALDFVTKPLESDVNRAREALRRHLEPILSVIVQRRALQKGGAPSAAPGGAKSMAGKPKTTAGAPARREPVRSRPVIPQKAQPAPRRPGSPPEAGKPTPPTAAPTVGKKAREEGLQQDKENRGPAEPAEPKDKPLSAAARFRPARGTRPAAGTTRPAAGAKPGGAGKPGRPDLLLIGSSTGGPAALSKVLAGIGRALPIPALIVQHMPPVFTASLAAQLSRSSGLDVREAADGVEAPPGQVILAMGGKHLALTQKDGRILTSLNNGPKVNECRPAVDVLFMSALAAVSGNVLAVILTGMGRDGANGVDALKRSGKTWCITQDRNSCVVYGMPRSVDEMGLSDESLPLDRIGPRILEICG